MDFVHCNVCYTCPSNASSQQLVFYFSSCGHLFCVKCLKKDNGINATPVTRDNATCRVCNKTCAYLEINRDLKPEVMMFFRNPRDLATQYMQNMKSVLDFQSQQRSRLQKHAQEKTNKAMKYVKMAQSEVSKRAEMEKRFVAERSQFKSELEKQTERTKTLEAMVAERDVELHQLRQKLAAKSKTSRASSIFPSLNGATPINTLSFLGCATSTPINNEMDLFEDMQLDRARNGNEDRNDLAGSQFNDIFAVRPGELESPVAGGGFMNTPAMLGISQRQPNTVSRGGNYF